MRCSTCERKDDSLDRSARLWSLTLFRFHARLVKQPSPALWTMEERELYSAQSILYFALFGSNPIKHKSGAENIMACTFNRNLSK